jgi:hypothetical protein
MDDSTIPTRSLQEVKVSFFGQAALIGTLRPPEMRNPEEREARGFIVRILDFGLRISPMRSLPQLRTGQTRVILV